METSNNPNPDTHNLKHDATAGYSMREAIDEAKRCLNCKIPQCRKGCPIGNDIPDWIHELSMGNIGNALKIINNKSNLQERASYKYRKTGAVRG